MPLPISFSRSLLVLAFAVVACKDDPDPTSPILDLTVTLDDETVTMAHVTWTGTPGATDTLEVVDAEGNVSAEPQVTVGDGSCSTTLIGLRAETTYAVRVVEDDHYVTTTSADVPFTTDRLPSWMPGFDLTEGTPDALGAPYVLGSVVVDGDGQGYVWMIDGEGHVAWYLSPTVQTIPSARLTRDGAHVAWMSEGHDLDILNSRIVISPLDGSDPTEIPVPYAHHDFVEMPDGRFAVIEANPRTVGDMVWVGDDIALVDRSGHSEVLWSSFDHLAVEDRAGEGLPYYSFGLDWTHANGIDYDEVNHRFLLSLYRYDAVLAIDADSGEVLWTLGGPYSDFTFDADVGFGPQHSPVFTASGLFVFDNGYDVGSDSHVAHYSLDPTDMTAHLDVAWAPNSGLYVPVMGTVHALPEGGLLTSWGQYPLLVAVDTQGQPSWRMNLNVPASVVMGHVETVDALSL